MRFTGWLLSCMLLSGVAHGAEAVDTLVVKQGAMVLPGMAKSWHADGTTVTFVLQDGTDAAATAQTLNERLAGVKATGTGNTLVVQGVPPNTLLDQLASLHLVSNVDPLQDLGGLGGTVVASRAPESGGSIRAGKPVAIAEITGQGTSAPQSAAPVAVDANQRLDVEVVKVERGAFPQVVLHLKVRHPAKANTLAVYKTGTTFMGTVTYTGNRPFDPTDAAHVHNAVAYYLAVGDKVWVHPVAAPAGEQHVAELDWLERPGVTIP